MSQKGADDIWVVFNVTSCGLNGSLYGRHFGLTTLLENLRSIVPHVYMADSDFEVVFNIFIVHQDVWDYISVDIRHIRTNEPWDLGRASASWGGRKWVKIISARKILLLGWYRWQLKQNNSPMGIGMIY